MTNRPYFRHGIDQLEALFNASKNEMQSLAVLQYELSFRDRPKAKALKKQVDDQVQKLLTAPSGSQAQFAAPPVRDAVRETQRHEQSPPERISVECAHCNTPNFVSTLEGIVQNLSCSSCYTPYTAQFKYGVLRTKFLPVAESPRNYSLVGVLALVLGAIVLILLLK